MNFLAPAGLWLLALAIPLIVLYFIRTRRRELQVPSLLLWDTAPVGLVQQVPIWLLLDIKRLHLLRWTTA